MRNSVFAPSGKSLLSLHSVISVPAVERFAVDQHFKKGNLVGNRRIGYIGRLFPEFFGDATESSVPTREVKVWSTIDFTTDRKIIEALGGKENPELLVSMAHVHYLLSLGDTGPCLFTTGSNFCYTWVEKHQRVGVVTWDAKTNGMIDLCVQLADTIDEGYPGNRVFGG
jgi:hypothetical protein